MFPAVSFCNLNPFTTSDSIVYVQDQVKKLNISSAGNGAGQAVDRNYRIESMLNLMLIQMNVLTTNDSFRQSFSRRLNESILTCTFNLVKCDLLKDFDWYYDSLLGNCYRFNSIIGNASYKQLKSNSISGQLNGLQMEIYLGNLDITLPIIFKNGLRVIVHNNSISTYAVDEGIDISPGFETNIEVSRVFDYRQPLPFTDCIKADTSFDSDFYRVSVMQNKTYRQKLVEYFCNL